MARYSILSTNKVTTHMKQSSVRLFRGLLRLNQGGSLIQTHSSIAVGKGSSSWVYV